MNVVEVARLCKNQAALTAAYRHSLPLQEKGWLTFPAVSWDQPAFIALDGDMVVGLLSFSEDHDNNEVDIRFAFTEPGYPRALAMLLMRLRRKYAGSDFRAIAFSHHVDNEPMAKAARALKASPLGRSYRMPIARLSVAKPEVRA